MMILAGVLVLAGIAGGGYFVYVSAAVSVILLSVGLYRIVRADQILVACDGNLLAVGAGTAGFLFSAFWAVDSGMAMMGFIKFLPVLLYLLFICQKLEQREQLISMLPVMGSTMTIISFIMMQFPIWKEYVSVSGRLAGFFQYPNTYAIFMLICFIISVYEIGQEKPLWFSLGCMALLLCGIFMSGSRTVFILTAMTALALILLKREIRCVMLPFLALCFFAVVAAGVWAGGNSILRLFQISANSSTFLGRILYARDSVPLILRYPFGLGYYGYYFMQQEIQTGVYSVVSVHNELLQFMLDTGVIPALLFYGCVLRSIFSHGTCMRNKLVLSVLLLHSLFDYDFQFLVMMLVLLLFLDICSLKEIKVTQSVRIFVSFIAVILILTAVLLGCSGFCYSRGMYRQSLKWYPRNTMAEIMLLGEAETAKEMENLADSILLRNAHVAGAYSARARAAFVKGDMEGFIRDKLTAIDLAPYQYEEYLDYMDSLFFAMDQYIEAEDMESARMCLKRVEAVPALLKETETKTSRLGWEIQDRPETELPPKYLKVLEEKKREINMKISAKKGQN